LVEPLRQFESRHVGHFDVCQEQVNRPLEFEGLLNCISTATGNDEMVADETEDAKPIADAVLRLRPKGWSL
jgi:hypothetical protein